MKKSIGLLELKSIPVGIESADEMLKSADVELVLATPICPGKYVIIITGNVGAVKSAMKSGEIMADAFLIESHIINNVHESVLPALSGLVDIYDVKALGIIETISALSAIKAGDIAAKSSNVKLMEIRVARGLGGKGFVLFTGEVSSVKTAVKSCMNDLKNSGEITSTAVIPSPNKKLIEKLL